tara:strand:+ start:210 stop:1508 length:1299 start_codon:yes stop_codon:yes gene_type:complete
MKKGKGEKGKGSGGSVGKSSLKGGSGSVGNGVGINYKVVSIVVVVLLLLFLVFVFNRGGDSEDSGLGSLFSFRWNPRIDLDLFPFSLSDLEFGPESDSDPESEYDPGCPREGDDEGLTQICNRAPEADDAENEFICCKESQECDTTEDGEPSCNDGLPEGEEGSYCENDNEPEGPITCLYNNGQNYWCCPEDEPHCKLGPPNTCESDPFPGEEGGETDSCPPNGNPDLTTTCYGQQGTAGKDGIICCTEDQRCATNGDGEPTCVNSLPEGNNDNRCITRYGPQKPILCKINKVQYCCAEDKPYCFIDEDGEPSCGPAGHLCNGASLDEGKTCCGADEGEEWICPPENSERLKTCGPPGTRMCIKEGSHACEDTGVLYACPEGKACCEGKCCPEGAMCTLPSINAADQTRLVCRNAANVIVAADPGEEIEVNV